MEKHVLVEGGQKCFWMSLSQDSLWSGNTDSMVNNVSGAAVSKGHASSLLEHETSLLISLTRVQVQAVLPTANSLDNIWLYLSKDLCICYCG